MNALCPKIVISFDFELGWGVLDSPLWRKREADSLYLDLRQVFDHLIEAFSESQIRTTWAMVGSLLAKSEAELDLEHLPASYRDSVISFYRESHETTRGGLDLVDKLQKIDDLVEIASHTSTHIYAEYPGVTAAGYVSDVSNSISVLEKYFGRSVRSLVFPRDQARFNNDVAVAHPLNFRLNPNFGKKIGRLNRMINGAGRFYKNVPQSKVIMGAHGEYYQTGSLYFNWSGGKYESIKKYLTTLQSKRMLSEMTDGDVYHVWLHPFNLAESREHLEQFLKFIRDIARLRDDGMLEVVTMDDLVGECKKEFFFNV